MDRQTRIGKACDRCRVKKVKCDGGELCSRCMTDNSLCMYSDRTRARQKPYPKGYIEMLERQQEQLVNGLREMYSLLQSGRGWPGHCLSEANGSTPLTHDILKELGVLQQTQDDYRTCEHVECYSLQQKLLEVRQICFLEDSTESPVCAQSLELSLLPPQEEMEETFHTGSSDYSDAVPGLLSRHPYLFLQDFCKSSVPPTVAPSMFSHATSSDFQANAAMIGNEQLSFWNNLPMSLEGCGMR